MKCFPVREIILLGRFIGHERTILKKKMDLNFGRLDKQTIGLRAKLYLDERLLSFIRKYLRACPYIVLHIVVSESVGQS